MATRPTLANKFGFKDPDPAYLERGQRAIEEARPIARALRARYPRGILADRRERAAQEQAEALEDETP